MEIDLNNAKEMAGDFLEQVKDDLEGTRKNLETYLYEPKEEDINFVHELVNDCVDVDKDLVELCMKAFKVHMRPLPTSILIREFIKSDIYTDLSIEDGFSKFLYG